MALCLYLIFKLFLNIFCSIGLFIFCKILRCSCKDYLSAVFSGFRTYINNIICTFDNIRLVLNNNHRVSQVYQSLKRLQ